MKADDKRHGTVAGYGAGCRSNCCRRAASKYENLRRLGKMHGTTRLVDRGPAIERLRALQALGWPSTELSSRLGRSRNYVSAFVTRTDNTKIRADVDKQISALFDALSMTIGPSSITRARSAMAGWLPPLALDDHSWGVVDTMDKGIEKIDAVFVQRALEGDWPDFSAATLDERREITRRWPTTGRSYAELARLSGWNVDRYKPARDTGEAA